MADKEMFSYWVTQPELLEKSDIEKLERITEQYPYFQLAHMLLAKAVSIGQPESLTRYLPRAAVHSLSRKSLQMLVENEMEWSVELLDRLTRTKPSSVERQPLPEEKPVADKPRTGGQNDSQVPLDPTVIAEFALAHQLIRKPESGQEEQSRSAARELIDRFIKADPVIGALSREPDQQGEVEDLSLRSQIALEDLATESFAEILEKQGKTERAIAIYEKLILKIPEKKDYFAKKIENLRKV